MHRLLEFKPEHEAIVIDRLYKKVMTELKTEFPHVKNIHETSSHFFDKEEKTLVTNQLHNETSPKNKPKPPFQENHNPEKGVLKSDTKNAFLKQKFHYFLHSLIIICFLILIYLLFKSKT